MARARPKLHYAEIEEVVRGVATYRLESGAKVLCIHHSADPEKGHAWARENASTYPGGLLSPEWQQEYDMDPDARQGVRVYWGFSRRRNLVDPFPMPDGWRLYIGIDYGQTAATAIIFTAQDPESKRAFVCDSIYRPRGISADIKREVYEKVAEHRGVSIRAIETGGLSRYVDLIVGDPRGPEYAAFYGMEPWPINVCSFMVAANLSGIPASESRLNSVLFPSAFCCGKEQFPSEDAPEENIKCANCRTEHTPTPMLLLMRGRAPELEDQLDSLVRKPPANSLLETPEVNVKSPDHATDALRYQIRAMDFERMDAAERTSDEEILAKLLAKRTLSEHESIDLEDAYAAVESKKADVGKTGRLIVGRQNPRPLDSPFRRNRRSPTEIYVH